MHELHRTFMYCFLISDPVALDSTCIRVLCPALFLRYQLRSLLWAGRCFLHLPNLSQPRVSNDTFVGLNTGPCGVIYSYLMDITELMRFVSLKAPVSSSNCTLLHLDASSQVWCVALERGTQRSCMTFKNNCKNIHD